MNSYLLVHKFLFYCVFPNAYYVLSFNYKNVIFFIFEMVISPEIF